MRNELIGLIKDCIKWIGDSALRPLINKLKK